MYSEGVVHNFSHQGNFEGKWISQLSSQEDVLDHRTENFRIAC